MRFRALIVRRNRMAATITTDLREGTAARQAPAYSRSVAHDGRGATAITAIPGDEWRLIQACKQGDHDAWNRLIRRHERSIYKFAYILARNYDDAADIAGQVFMRL